MSMYLDTLALVQSKFQNNLTTVLLKTVVIQVMLKKLFYEQVFNSFSFFSWKIKILYKYPIMYIDKLQMRNYFNKTNDIDIH